MRAPAPAYVLSDADALASAFGDRVERVRDEVGEVALHVARERLVAVLRALRDEHGFQQLMEIAGVDYPDRAERFEVVYCLLSVTKNQRLRVHVSADEESAVPTVTGLWPVAGWLEREVYDMYGVFFEGNPDLRRILTDYGFTGHPFRKDFPLSGFVELRYSEEAKRVVYEPVQLAQDFRTFDFTSPWEGAEYVLPGDEKAERAGAPMAKPAAALPQEKGAQSPVTADQVQQAAAAEAPEQDAKAPSQPYGKTAEGPSETGAGKSHPHGTPTPPDPDIVPNRTEGAVAQKPDATDEASVKGKGA